MKTEFENVSRQLRGWADSLQNSNIKGQRHLNNESRGRFERQKRREVFDREMRQHKIELEERLKREAAERKRKSE